MTIESTQPVDDVMRRWPATIRVFLNHRMRCVGCPIACFHTVEDACREHKVDRAAFLADLRAAAPSGGMQGLGPVLTAPGRRMVAIAAGQSGEPSASRSSLWGSRIMILWRPPATRPWLSQALRTRLTVCSVAPVISATSWRVIGKSI